MTLEGNALIEASVTIAAYAHEGQKDLVGEPYILHPFRVMNNAYRMLDGDVYSPFATYVLATAALHDTIEDTTVTEGFLVMHEIPQEVIDAVKLLTRPKTKHNYFDYVRGIKASGNKIAITVKLADLMDNTDSVRGNVLKTRDRAKYADRQAKYKSAINILKPSLFKRIVYRIVNRKAI